MDYNPAVIQKRLQLMIKTNPSFPLLLALLVCALACDSGSYADSTGVCQQCDISCNTCKSSDGCSTCYDQMFLVARGSLIVCDVCYNVNKGCDICLTASKCQTCSAGYFLQGDNTCESCSQLFPNCLLCETGNVTECISCKNPFQLINGQCLSNSTDSTQTEAANTPAASTTTDTTAALTVGQAYQAVMGVSTPQQDTSSSSASGQCDPSQVNVNGTCYSAIAFCLAYSPVDGSCLTCSSIFVLSNGYCLPSTLVSAPATATPSTPTCTSRQYLSNGVCNDVGAQCLQFDSSTGACYLCASGFTATNGLCVQQVPPTSSSSSPASQSPDAASSLPHCQTTDPADATHCLVCVSGYTIVDALPGVCFKIN